MIIMSETVYCSKCGAMNTTDSNFCVSCGASLAPPKKAVPPTTAPPPPPPPQYTPPPPPTTGTASYPPPTQMTDAQLMTVRKNEALSVILTIILPGLGHLYLNKIKRGLVFIVISIIMWIIGATVILIPITVVWYLYAIYDSYQLTKKHNEALFSLRRPPQEDEF
jgi:TM2 domain-containing membrane protein YozV